MFVCFEYECICFDLRTIEWDFLEFVLCVYKCINFEKKCLKQCMRKIKIYVGTL